MSGLLASVQGLGSGVLALARTRLELVSAELQEELTRLAVMLTGMLVVLLLAALGIAFAGAALLIWLPADYRAIAAAAMAFGLLALAGAAAWSLRRTAREKPRLLDRTLTELERDHAALLAAQSAAQREDLSAQVTALAGKLNTVGAVAVWVARLAPLLALLRRA